MRAGDESERRASGTEREVEEGRRERERFVGERNEKARGRREGRLYKHIVL